MTKVGWGNAVEFFQGKEGKSFYYKYGDRPEEYLGKLDGSSVQGHLGSEGPVFIFKDGDKTRRKTIDSPLEGSKYYFREEEQQGGMRSRTGKHKGNRKGKRTYRRKRRSRRY